MLSKSKLRPTTFATPHSPFPIPILCPDLPVIDFHLGHFGGRLIRSLCFFRRNSRPSLGIVLRRFCCARGKLLLPLGQRRSCNVYASSTGRQSKKPRTSDNVFPPVNIPVITTSPRVFRSSSAISSFLRCRA